MFWDKLTEEERQALIEFGFELQRANWEPDQPIFDTFSGQFGNDGKWYGLAIAFIKQHREAFQGRLCKDSAVKLELQASTSIVAAVADSIQSMMGLPLPTMMIANILCMLGLHKFCSWNPDKPV